MTELDRNCTKRGTKVIRLTHQYLTDAATANLRISSLFGPSFLNLAGFKYGYSAIA